MSPGSSIYAVRLLVLLTLLIVAGCRSEEDARRAALAEEFQAACPQPDWWDRVSTDDEAIRTYSELLERWRADDRSDSEFFKAAYQAIVDYPEDTAIVVSALNLIPNVAGSYPHLISCLEFAVDRYSRWDRPMANYGGKPGDTVAGLVRDLAGQYNAQGAYEKTIPLIERLLEERESEINDQLLELLALPHAEALAGAGRRDEAAGVLRDAIEAYDGDWEDRLRRQLGQYETP